MKLFWIWKKSEMVNQEIRNFLEKSNREEYSRELS